MDNILFYILGFISGSLSLLSVYFHAVIKDALKRKPLGQRIGA